MWGLMYIQPDSLARKTGNFCGVQGLVVFSCGSTYSHHRWNCISNACSIGCLRMIGLCLLRATFHKGVRPMTCIKAQISHLSQSSLKYSLHRPQVVTFSPWLGRVDWKILGLFHLVNILEYTNYKSLHQPYQCKLPNNLFVSFYNGIM